MTGFSWFLHSFLEFWVPCQSCLFQLSYFPYFLNQINATQEFKHNLNYCTSKQYLNFKYLGCGLRHSPKDSFGTKPFLTEVSTSWSKMKNHKNNMQKRSQKKIIKS